MNPEELGLDLPPGFKAKEDDHSITVNGLGQKFVFDATRTTKKQIEKEVWQQFIKLSR